jgi:branched-chain amino acid transport system ATP-binding protein
LVAEPSTTGGPILEVEDLEVAYGDLQVLWGVSLAVSPGEMVCLLGPNGSGKSTLMNAISGLVRPKGGRVLFEGERIDGRPPHEITARGIAHVLERRRLFPYMTVEENLLLGAYLPAAAAQRADSLERLYTRFPVLKEKRRLRAGLLSGGEQQILVIARALMTRPRCLMVDEPFLGLAARVQDLLMAFLAEVNRDGMTVLFIDQNVRRALSRAHRGYVLQSGRVSLTGTGDAILSHPELERIYFTRPR